MLLHVPGTLASVFYDDYSENQVSAQIVMVFASIAPVLSIMSIQRGDKGMQQVVHFTCRPALLGHFRQVSQSEDALVVIICKRDNDFLGAWDARKRLIRLPCGFGSRKNVRAAITDILHLTIHHIINVKTVWQCERRRSLWWTYRELSAESAAPLGFMGLYSRCQLISLAVCSANLQFWLSERRFWPQISEEREKKKKKTLHIIFPQPNSTLVYLVSILTDVSLRRWWRPNTELQVFKHMWMSNRWGWIRFKNVIIMIVYFHVLYAFTCFTLLQDVCNSLDIAGEAFWLLNEK